MSAIRRIVTVLVASVCLAGCQEDGSATSDTGDDTGSPAILLPQQIACQDDGGRWGRVPGRVTFVCYQTTRDANKACSTKRDCEGLCLARSRTCAPQTPLFGCHEVINASGLRQTLCIE